MASDCPLPVLATRSNQLIELLQGENAFEKNTPLMQQKGPSRLMGFNKDGTRFLYCDGLKVKVLDISCGDVLFEVAKQKTQDFAFSPKSTYLALYEDFFTTPSNPQGNPNMDIYNLKTGQLLKSMIMKKRNGWQPRWSSDEELCARCVSNEVQFYNSDQLDGTAIKKLYMQGVSEFTFGTTSDPLYVATYVQGKKGNPSFVRLWQYPNFDEGNAICNKSFFKADKVDMMWNKKGTALLVMTSVEIDTTGASYYGEQSLHFMSTRGESNMVSLEKTGPIYSVTWSNNSTQFAVVYGYMPAKATLFNNKCEVVFDYGTGPRNIAHFNPHGNILCLAGFGNLRGGLEMWNVQGKKMLSKFEIPDVTHFEWCPDGEHVLTSTLTPKLRISNGFSITHYTGKKKYEMKCPNQVELYQTVWQPQCSSLFPEPKLTKGPTIQAAKKETYRPPSARGTAPKPLLIHEIEKPSNQKDNENLSAAALKNKKKREAKAKRLEQEKSNPSIQEATSPSNEQAASTNDPDKDKKIRALNKKLRQVTDLKEKQKSGVVLEKNQLDKLSSEADIIKELEALKVS